jgi:hypothetical protein
MIAGCPIFPSDNIWNVPIDSLPVHGRSAQWVDTIGRNTGFHMDFGSGTWAGGPIGMPYNVVDSTVPKVSVSFYYEDESDPGPYPVPNNPSIEHGSDHHILILDNSTCTLYELFDASHSGGTWYAGSGAIWDLNSNALRPDTWTSADAAGLPILPGLVRYDEILSGEINHAIRFTAQNTNGYIWPARHLTSNDPNAPQIPPMGARFRLKASYDISSYPSEMQVILRAMKTYGIILADNGSNWYVSGAPDSRWDNDMLHLLDDLTGNDFEAVDTSTLIVDYNSGAAVSGPEAATLVSPTGSIETNNPTYTWNEVSDATWYYLWVNGHSGKIFDKWYTAAQAGCNGTTCSVAGATPGLSAGAHTWWVQTWNNAGDGPWSAAKSFTPLALPLPGKATLVSPAVSVETNNPTYRWNEVSGSTWYYLWVEGPSGSLIKKWYTSAQANCDGTTCSVAGATPDIPGGNYTWWIQTWNEAGIGPWSTRMDFSAPIPAVPGKAALVSPGAAVGIRNPTYRWNEVSGSTWYYLWVEGPSGNVIKKWYTSAQANCNGTTCSIDNATALLADGSYTWWIQTWNVGGDGPWSKGMSFSITPPGQASLTAPQRTGIANPTYTWNEVPGSTWYYLWVNGPSGNVIKKWYTAAEANCNGTTCSVIPGTTLSSGAHTGWIQTWNELGEGPWSEPLPFLVP